MDFKKSFHYFPIFIHKNNLKKKILKNMKLKYKKNIKKYRNKYKNYPLY